ncbi:MAG: hypothetical protein GXP16_09090 [Gammaproteobacteria bacterium]|nr:hypothetical protein [Gammaproteobacteria bacterium]
MDIGYGYKRLELDLLARGADRVYIDTNKERPQRADMLEQVALRSGDTLIVMSERDLGGSPKADAKIKKILAERGVELVIKPPVSTKQANGRPSTLKSAEAAMLEEMHKAWHNPYWTEAGRVRECSRIAGQPVTKGQMVYRFGTQEKPKK